MTLLRVHLPALWPSLSVAALLVFIEALKELGDDILAAFGLNTLDLHLRLRQPRAGRGNRRRLPDHRPARRAAGDPRHPADRPRDPLAASVAGAAAAAAAAAAAVAAARQRSGGGSVGQSRRLSTCSRTVTRASLHAIDFDRRLRFWEQRNRVQFDPLRHHRCRHDGSGAHPQYLPARRGLGHSRLRSGTDLAELVRRLAQHRRR